MGGLINWGGLYPGGHISGIKTRQNVSEQRDQEKRIKGNTPLHLELLHVNTFIALYIR